MPDDLKKLAQRWSLGIKSDYQRGLAHISAGGKMNEDVKRMVTRADLLAQSREYDKIRAKFDKGLRPAMDAAIKAKPAEKRTALEKVRDIVSVYEAEIRLYIKEGMNKPITLTNGKKTTVGDVRTAVTGPVRAVLTAIEDAVRRELGKLP